MDHDIRDDRGLVLCHSAGSESERKTMADVGSTTRTRGPEEYFDQIDAVSLIYTLASVLWNLWNLIFYGCKPVPTPSNAKFCYSANCSIRKSSSPKNAIIIRIFFRIISPSSA